MAVTTAAVVFGAFVALRYLYIHTQGGEKSSGNQMVVVMGRKGASPQLPLPKANRVVPPPVVAVAKAVVSAAPMAVLKGAVVASPNTSGIAQIATPQRQLLLKSPEDDKPLAIAGGEQLAIARPQQIIYEVAKGDRLDLIAYRFYGSHKKYSLLLQANPGIKANTLRPGTKLVVPGVDSPKENFSAIRVVSRDVRRDYVIKEREVLSVIAERELGSVKLLPVILDFNPGLNPNKLRAGQTIHLPIKKDTSLTL